jgi:hypothetical protein
LLLAVVFAGQGCGSGGGGLVQATTCAGTFTACGGDPTGTWDLVGVCVEGDLVAANNAESSASSPACGSTVTAATIAGGGSVTYGAGTVTFNATIETAMSMVYTPACVSALSGGGSLNALTCSQQAASMDAGPNTAATCSYTGGNCNCTLTATQVNTSTRQFTVSGSTITEGGGDSYTFCVNGNTMTQREQVTGDAYAVTTMKKR